MVGALQLDVLAERLESEYGLPVSFEQSRFEVCRWVSSEDRAELDKFVAAYPSSIAADLDGAPVFLASSAFNLRYDQERWPKIVFADVKDYQKKGDVLSGREAARPRCSRSGSAPMQGKTVVATGATSGIGEVAVVELARQGARIVFIARDAQRAEATLAKLEADRAGPRPSRPHRRSVRWSPRRGASAARSPPAKRASTR